MTEYYAIDFQRYIQHFGVKGMKWGVRKDTAIYTKRKMVRYANDEPLDSKRKYMAYKHRDKSWYKADAQKGNLWIKDGDVYKYTYKPNKKLRIAPYEEVSKYIMQKNGKSYDGSKYQGLSYKNFLKVKKDEAAGKEFDAIMDIHKKYMKTQLKDIREHFKDYDGIVDPEDRMYGYKRPVVIFEPDQKLTLQKKKKIKTKY